MLRSSDQEHARYVRELFSRIAHRYDLINRLMTAGQDVGWRRQVIRLANLTPHASLLDLGAGTGDLAFEAIRQEPQARVIAADFTLAMMRVGQQNGDLAWSAADALCLPFGEGSFDAIVSGFLMRNVADVPRALQEQHRVLKSGGRIVLLDTTRPRPGLLLPFIWMHMHIVIPALGGLLSGVPEAYTYLPESTEHFLLAEQLALHMRSAGFKQVGFRRLMFGTVAIHWGEK